MINFKIIDVREPEEFTKGHIDGALNIPPTELTTGAAQLSDMPKDTKLVLYCVSGARSRASIQLLLSMGFTNLVNGVNQAHVQQMLDRDEL